MLPIFKPLCLEGIEEGRFLELADEDMKTLQQKLVAFVQEYQEQAEKSTATLTITLQLKCLDVKTLTFGVKAGTKMSLPQRPASLTMATAAEDEDDGQPRLFARKTGSDSRHPAQGKLVTNKGEPIDPDTGEVLTAPDGKSRGAGET
jgi:hypothetical protein